MEDKENNAPHWCAELFPPTFTCDDILDVSVDKKSQFTLPNDFYSNIYSQVILEEELQQKSKQKKQRTKNTSVVHVESHTSSEDVNDNLNGNDVLWTHEDLKLFREAYVKLKERAVKLLCIVEAKNLKLKDLKKTNKEIKKELKVKDNLISDMTKENTILKGYVKTHEKFTADLEEKLQFYEDCNNDLKEIIHEREKEISNLRMELRNETKLKKEYFNRNNELKKSHLDELSLIKESITTEYENEIISLKVQIDDVKMAEKLLQQECTKYKNSFLDLQKHFMCGETKIFFPETTDRVSEEREFLGVADIN